MRREIGKMVESRSRVSKAFVHTLSYTILFLLLTQLATAGRFKESPNPVAGSYIVTLKPSAELDDVPLIAQELARGHGVTLKQVWKHAFPGFAIETTEARARALAKHPHVFVVEENAYVFLAAGQNPAPVHLDRLDETALQLDGSYNYCTTGYGVRVYVVDTGVWGGHSEFVELDACGLPTGGSRVESGYNHPHHWNGTADNPCTQYDDWALNWHGTAVASLIAGRTLGVAKKAKIVPVRAFGCGGTATIAEVVDGLEWIVTDASAAGSKAVINMSFYSEAELKESDGTEVANYPPDGSDPDGDGCWMKTAGGGNQYKVCALSGMEAAVQTLLSHGHTVVAAAGNTYQKVGDNPRHSPAWMPGVLTAGAVDQNDFVWRGSPPVGDDGAGSCYGKEIDVFSTAVNIEVASSTNRNDPSLHLTDQSGTSFAAAMVSGVAARWLQTYPGYTGDLIQSLIVSDAKGVVNGLPAGSDTPNKMLYKSMGRCSAVTTCP